METIEKSEFLKKTIESISNCKPNTYGKVTVMNNEPSKVLLIEIYGSEYLDRTILTMTAIASIQKLGGIAAFIDIDNNFDRDYAEKLGVDIGNLIISKQISEEEGVEVAENLISCGAIDIVVVCSVSELQIKTNPLN